VNNGDAAFAEFVGKWRTRWPEWGIAEVFITPQHRAIAVAWFALLDEFADAAWSGRDAAPGMAKLAWWQQELLGWDKGGYRHPLGQVLQAQDAPWSTLATAMPVLGGRDLLGAGGAAALSAIEPLARAAAQIECAMFGRSSDPAISAVALLAAPMAARSGQAQVQILLQALPRRPIAAPRELRLRAALLRQRLQAQAAHGGEWQPAARWRLPWAIWRAARN